tara:strand:+ start:199 stop:600 length:402 start_codon:yes stop_codon:yes gene_type:complete
MGILGYSYKAGKNAGKAIKSIKPASRLTERRKNTEDLMNIRKKYNLDPKKANIASTVKKTSAVNDKYDAAVKARKVKNKKLKKKVIGGATAASAAVLGANEVAKKKFPKYKKTMESSVTIKDGKLKLKPKKEK